MALGIFATLVLLLELIDGTRQRRKAQLAQYEAREWRQRAEAAARVADRLARELADEIDAHCGAGPQVEGGFACCTAGMIVH